MKHPTTPDPDCIVVHRNDAKLSSIFFSFLLPPTGFTCQPLGPNFTNSRFQHWCKPQASDFRPNFTRTGRCWPLPWKTRKNECFLSFIFKNQKIYFFQNLNADLQKFVNLNDLPELLLSVCYNATLQRLTVNVVEGKNFKVNSAGTHCLKITQNVAFEFLILAFSTNFCPIKIDLSGNTVWPQVVVLQKSRQIDHFWHF